MPIRSGRFKIPGATKIVDGVSRPNAAYRIFNSGDSTIILALGPAGTATDVSLWPACSIDVEVGDVSVSASNATEGIYDYLDPLNSIRAGRFQFKNAAEDEITIVKGRSREFYRILNSGQRSFVIKPKGAGTPANERITLEPTFSVDVAQNDIVILGAAGESVEGIYECLDSRVPIRSGRFKIGISNNPQNQHKIVDLSTGGTKAWYRIFNSGDNTIIVEKGSQDRSELLVAPVEIGRLAREQSFDFEVGAGSKEIFVRSTDSSLAIEGIYEFLGKD